MILSWRLWAGVVVLGGLTFSHIYVYSLGKSAVYDRLAADRVQIIEDGKRIDEKVLRADDSLLCDMLGGCLSNSSD